MDIWSQASGLESCTKPVQVAFAKKFVEEEMAEKIKEQAEFEEVELDFKTYVELARALCQTSSQLFARRVDFFLLKCKDQSAKGFIEYMSKIMKEYKAVDVGAMAGDPRSYAVYKAIAEMPASLRNRVVKTMEREMSFEELRTELEKVASLKVMEEAVGKPKITKITIRRRRRRQAEKREASVPARRLQPSLVRVPPLWRENRSAPRGPELLSGKEGLGVQLLRHKGLPR